LWVAPRPSVRVAQERAAIFVDAGWRTLPASFTLWGGGNGIEAEDAHEHHTHERGGKQEGLPTGLKGNILHAYLPALQCGREVYLTRIIGFQIEI
jgi:hypothetical protein